MNKIVKSAVLAVVTAATLGGLSGSAHAECYVQLVQPTGLGVCASVKPEPGKGTCVHVAVYTDVPSGDPDPLFCTGT